MDVETVLEGALATVLVCLLLLVALRARRELRYHRVRKELRAHHAAERARFERARARS